MAHNYRDPENDMLIGRTEVERREGYFNRPEGRSLGDQHPLIVMIRRCLHNEPSERPTTEQLVTGLEGMRVNIDGPFGDDARMYIMRQIATMRETRTRDTEMREKNEEIEQLQQQIVQIQALHVL